MCLGNRGLFRQQLDEAGVHLDVEQTNVLSELLERRSGRLEPLSRRLGSIAERFEHGLRVVHVRLDQWCPRRDL